MLTRIFLSIIQIIQLQILLHISLKDANGLAENYNSEANLDDGTCVVFGCMNDEADNYNPEATLQDDSCILYGCTNETAENYNDQASDDDGSCIIYGCTIRYLI